MAPISPTSRKRSTLLSEGNSPEEPASKRRCMKPTLPQTPPPEDQTRMPDVAKIPLFDDEPRRLLTRSVALILEHVGFSTATEEAMEALCSQVDTYAAHFLSQITSSMLNGRRSEPTPLDFRYALSQFSLPMASLEPHLKPPIAAPTIHLELEPLPEKEFDQNSAAILLGDELSGEKDKNNKPYIPKNFPSFPSKHTYKWTDKDSARETDPRKIREEAAKLARQGEEALRGLVKISKARREKDLKRLANKDPRSKERHELWELAKANASAGKERSADDDRAMIVNSESQYFRKGVTRNRRVTGQAEA